jgi:N6-adenosine-specific RNA methylase IME4
MSHGSITSPELQAGPSPAVLAIADIDVRGRSRSTLGDIAGLAASIERLGLLHPPVVTPDNKLVVGRRRVEAFKHLGRDTIPVNIARNFHELQLLLEAERDENICREAFTPEEAVHLGRRFEAFARGKAEVAKADGRKKGGGDRRSDGAKRSRKTFPKAKRDESKRVPAQSASVVGMSRPTFERAVAVVASGDRKLIDEMNRTGKVNGVHKRLIVAQKAARIAHEPPPLPEGPFRVIVCDPPWRYDKRPDDPTQRGALPYPSMTTDEIAALPVAARAHADCVLWLWTTNAHLPEAFGIVAGWGFEYKTMLTWAKHKMGVGDWLRGQTEHCLMCVRGKPTIQLTNQTTLLMAPAGEHSEKPAEFYERVEALCPGAKLEMFQRTPRAGWVGHCDEAEAAQ